MTVQLRKNSTDTKKYGNQPNSTARKMHSGPTMPEFVSNLSWTICRHHSLVAENNNITWMLLLHFYFHFRSYSTIIAFHLVPQILDMHIMNERKVSKSSALFLQFLAGGWLLHYTFGCQLVDRSVTPRNMRVSLYPCSARESSGLNL